MKLYAGMLVLGLGLALRTINAGLGLRTYGRGLGLGLVIKALALTLRPRRFKSLDLNQLNPATQ